MLSRSTTPFRTRTVSTNSSIEKPRPVQSSSRPSTPSSTRPQIPANLNSLHVSRPNSRPSSPTRRSSLPYLSSASSPSHSVGRGVLLNGRSSAPSSRPSSPARGPRPVVGVCCCCRDRENRLRCVCCCGSGETRISLRLLQRPSSCSLSRLHDSCVFRHMLLQELPRSCAGLKRTGKDCRMRWLNYLRLDILRGNITLEEQLLILEPRSRWGNRWSKNCIRNNGRRMLQLAPP
ncbi:hypothetical protein TB2_040803 [Malus domestica]